MCDELSDERLNEYLDGELDEVERQAVAAAIARSPEAQARLAELDSLFVALAALPDVPLERTLAPDVLTAITIPTATPRWLRLLPVAQILAAAFLVAWFWGTLQMWWQNGRALLPTSLPPFVLPDLHGVIDGWLTAVTSLPVPTFQIDLALYQWIILLTLALVIWLFGARLLFANPSRAPGHH